MARENLFKRRCFGWIMRHLHAFPVKRSKGDLGAIRESLARMKEGKPLVIFPEGTRSKDKNLKKGKPGIGFIAMKARVPIVPAYIEGSFDALPRGPDTLKRHPVKVYIGHPMDFSRFYGEKAGRAAYQKISDEIMLAIARLKDESALSR